MVAAASLVHALHAAAVYLAPATLLSPMRADLGLSVSEIALPLVVYRLVNAVLLVPAGAVLDRSRPDVILRASVVAAAVLGLALPFCSNLPQLLVLQSLFAVTKLFGGLTAMLLLISRSFGDRPGMGTATSVLLAGYSFAGFLAPTLVGSLCAVFGWRVASGAMSVLFLVVGVPLTMVFLRDLPPLPLGEDEAAPSATAATTSASASNGSLTTGGDRRNRASGGDITRRGGGAAKAIEGIEGTSPASVSIDRLTRPDSTGSLVSTTSAAPGNGTVTASGESAVDPPEATDAPDAGRLLTPAYLALLTVVASLSFSMHVVLDHLLVFLREDFGGGGLHLDVAARYLSALNLGALFTKLAVGPLADRYDKGLLMAAFGVLGCIASVFLFDWMGGALVLTSSTTQVAAFVGLYAVAYAGVFSLSTAALQDFGATGLGLRCNLNLVALFASGSVGSYVAGTLRTQFGTYVWAFVAAGSSWVGVVGAALAYAAAQRVAAGRGGYQKLPAGASQEDGRTR